MKNILIPILAATILCSCSKNEDSNQSQEDITKKVSFSGSTIATRTVGNEWEESDQVGIFMYKNSVSETAEFSNVCYTSTAKGDFSAYVDSESIYMYVEDKVDFYAYYPYQSDMSDAIYSADVSDQSDLGNIDFLIASITGVDKTTESVSFTFEHKLAMLTIDVIPNAYISSLERLEMSIEGLNSKAEYSIIDGSEVTAPNTPADLDLTTVEDTADEDGYIKKVSVSIMVLPETVSNGATLYLTFDGDGDGVEECFEVSLDGLTFEVGVNNEVEVAVGYRDASFSGSSVSPWNDYSGNTDDIYDAVENL